MLRTVLSACGGDVYTEREKVGQWRQKQRKQEE